VSEIDKGKRLGDEITADAERKSARIIAKAKSEEERMVAAARADAEAASRIVFGAAEAKAKTERARILAGTDLIIKRQRLEHLQRYLDQVCADALARLIDKEWSGVQDWLADQIRAGAGLLGRDAARLTLSERLSEEERAGFGKRVGFSGEITGAASLAAGEAILSSADGRLRYEVRFKDIFQNRQRELFAAALRALFGGEFV